MSLYERAVKILIREGGSDLHFAPNQRVGYRINGRIKKGEEIVTLDGSNTLLNILLSKVSPSVAGKIKEKLKERGNTGFSIEERVYIEEKRKIETFRFRVNVSKNGGGFYIVLRLINSEPPDINTLGFSEKALKGLEYVINRHSGLFLVVGGTGSGKSTTLASIIKQINLRQQKNIITLEDPIEYVHTPIQSQIVQKELWRDFPRFSDGLHSALREDPDVILVGEIRDRESLELCLKASETGHLVFGTLHTNDAVSTIRRLVSMAGDGMERLTRDRLSQVLIGVLAQKLAPKKDEKGRVLVYELFITDKGSLSMIRENKDQMIDLDTLSYSNSFNSCIRDIYGKGLITREVAEFLSPDLKYLNLDDVKQEVSVIE